MTSNGKNQYTWNDEDRLAAVIPVVPRHGDLKLAYTYDYQGRRVYTDRFSYDGNTGSWAAAARTFYQFQGWNVVCITQLNPVPGGYSPVSNTACVWGVDLSGSLCIAANNTVNVYVRLVNRFAPHNEQDQKMLNEVETVHKKWVNSCCEKD